MAKRPPRSGGVLRQARRPAARGDGAGARGVQGAAPPGPLEARRPGRRLTAVAPERGDRLGLSASNEDARDDMDKKRGAPLRAPHVRTEPCFSAYFFFVAFFDFFAAFFFAGMLFITSS